MDLLENSEGASKLTKPTEVDKINLSESKVNTNINANVKDASPPIGSSAEVNTDRGVDINLKEEFKEFVLRFFNYLKSGLTQAKGILFFPGKSLKETSLLDYKNIIQVYISTLVLYSILLGLISFLSQNLSKHFIGLASSSVYLVGFDIFAFLLTAGGLYLLGSEEGKIKEEEIPFNKIFRNLVVSSVLTAFVLLILSGGYYLFILPFLVNATESAITSLSPGDFMSDSGAVNVTSYFNYNLGGSSRLWVLSVVSNLLLVLISVTPYLIKSFFMYLFFRTESVLSKKHSQILSGVLLGLGLIQSLTILF